MTGSTKLNYIHWENDYIESFSGVTRKKFFQKIKVVKFLYVHGSKTNSDICEQLKISSPTSLSILNELIAEGFVERKGRGEPVGGRKPDLYGLKDNSLFVLAIEMSRYKTKMAIFNNSNDNITGVQTYSLELNNDIRTVEKLHEYAVQLIQSSGVDPAKLIGVGVNMPGLVDSKRGINYTYLHFAGKSLRSILEDKFKRPVFIENDAKAVALAEHRFGLAKGKKNVLVIFLDWGLGLGVIVDGQLYRGASGFACEFSHISMVEDGLLCHCGKLGCLETIASGEALARLAKEGIKMGKSTILTKMIKDDPDKTDTKVIVDAANRGDQYAINILSEVGINLGKGIALLIQLFNPELIILGGRVAEANGYITTPIQQSLNVYCMHQLREQTSILISEMGQNVGIMGAVAMVMENIFENYTVT